LVRNGLLTVPLNRHNFESGIMKKFFVVAVVFVLAACGAKLDGTYTDQMGISSYTFKSGKVTMSTMGVAHEQDYKIEDDKLKIITPQGTLVMNLLKDGSIEGPMGMKLTKKKD
jgi:hypothetical protein